MGEKGEGSAKSKQLKIDLVSGDLEETIDFPAEEQRKLAGTTFTNTQQSIQLTGVAISETTFVYTDVDSAIFFHVGDSYTGDV